jgi:hypothetical protein
MFPKYRHAPILSPLRKRCPVCNYAVYSLAGVHPQCAVRLQEPQQPAKNNPESGSDASIDIPVLGPVKEIGLA